MIVTLDRTIRSKNPPAGSAPEHGPLVQKLAETTGFGHRRMRRKRLVRAESFGAHQHRNLVEYLALAWGAHLGIVLTPDMLWYTLLCELTGLVAARPEAFRAVFTDAPTGADKTEITIRTPDVTYLPLDVLAEKLDALVPGGAHDFLPRFTTSGRDERLAAYAAFADMVSPYYRYSTYSCGFPHIDVRGTPEDWQVARDTWRRLGQRMPEGAGLAPWVNRVDAILGNAQAPSADWWRSMFRLEYCGSGGEVEVSGWLVDLFANQEPVRQSPKPDNFPTHVSTVTYRNVETDRRFEVKAGLLSSSIEDGTLVPQFGRVTLELLKEPELAPEEPFAGRVMAVGASEYLGGLPVFHDLAADPLNPKPISAAAAKWWDDFNAATQESVIIINERGLRQRARPTTRDQGSRQGAEMIRMSGVTGDGEPLFIFGIEPENIRRLMQEYRPIRVSLASMGGPNITVVIAYADELGRASLQKMCGPNTEVHVDPSRADEELARAREQVEQADQAESATDEDPEVEMVRVATVDGKVHVHFAKPIGGFSIDSENARALGRLFLAKADEADADVAANQPGTRH